MFERVDTLLDVNSQENNAVFNNTLQCNNLFRLVGEDQCKKRATEWQKSWREASYIRKLL